MAATKTLSGMSSKNVRMTFSDGTLGLSLTLWRLTRVKFWLERAASSSSSWSEVATSKMMPFLIAGALLGGRMSR